MPHPVKHILFIPGLILTAKTFYFHQIAAFTKLGYTCYMPDSKFYTSTTIPAVTSHILDDVVKGVDKFNVVALSYGGYVAFDLLRTVDPKRIYKVALMSTQATPDSPQATENRHRLMELAKQHGMEKVVDAVLHMMVAPESVERDPGMKQTFYDMANEVGVDGFIAEQTAIINRVDSRPTLSSIKAPVLVMSGEVDTLIPLGAQRDLVKQLRTAIDGDVGLVQNVGSSYSMAHRRVQGPVIIPKVGHGPPMEDPQRCTDILIDWFER